MRDGISGTQLVHLGTLTISGTTPAASAWVDIRDFDEASIVVVANTVTESGTGITATVQHGDTSETDDAANIDTADSVDGETISLSVTADTDDAKILGAVGYVGQKRYLRVNAVGTATADADLSIMAVLRRAHREPTTLVGTAVSGT